MRVFITGATGFVGRALVLRLRRDGHTPVAWVRSMARGATLLGREAELVSAADGEAAMDHAMTTCDAVVNLAGESIAGGRWSEARKRRLVDSRVSTTEMVVGSIKRVVPRPKTLVSASAVGFYGDRGIEAVDEHATPGNDFLAQLCMQWEAAALRAEALGVRVVIPRIGVVLGHEGGLLGQLLPVFMAGGGAVVGNGRQYIPWIHVHDLVESMVCALQDSRFSGPYNAVASAPVTNEQFTAALAQACHKKAMLRAPKAAMKVLMGEQATIALASARAVPAMLRRHDFHLQFETLQAALANLIDDQALSIRPIKPGMPSPLAHEYVDKRHPTYLLEAKTILRQPRPEVFDFFCRAENLGLMTPTGMAMQITGTPPNEVRAGLNISYKLKVGPVPLKWRTLIAVWQPDKLFVDAQLEGPYRAWWHQHHFDDAAQGTQMLDRVFYAPPLALLGRAANALIIKGQLQRIFWYRKSAITLRFGKGQ